MDVRIESRNINMSDKWKEEIESRVGDLRGYHPEATHARVVLTKSSHQRKGDNIAEAFVLITLPRKHTVTARKERKTFEEAIRAAFGALDLELKKFRDRRGDVGSRSDRTI